MVTCGMGSQGDGNGVDEAKANALGRQGSSLYNLTFDEVQNQLGGFGKPLNSMNLDELVKTVWTIEATQELGRNDCLQQQSSITMPRDLSNKTVDEVWQDIHKRDNSVNKINQERQLTLGEITLEDFLVKAGIIADSTHGKSQAEWPHYQIPGIHQTIEQQNSLPVFIPVHQVQQPLPVVPSPTYPENQMTMSHAHLIGTLSDTQPSGIKRIAPDNVIEKSVERRQKRMIKNRESAARSRARKQAYTHELENKVSWLEEENERLKKQKEIEKILPVPPPEPKYQLRRTSSI